MSRISVDVSSARIPVLQVGYQGENEVTDVLFDISSWITEFGEGVAQLRVKRPGNSEEESYVLSLTITDGIAVWTVSETDTFNKGNGKVQLSYLVGNIVKKAVIYPYKVGKSIVGADNPVDPFDSWIERSKAWAIGETLDGNAVPETDETYQNNAKYYAEQADILGSAQVVLATEQATLATEKATLATEKADAAAASETNAAASEAAVNGVSTQLTTRMSAIETEQSVQSARMDTFTSLPEGSTSGNSELADIRVGANGTTYDTAGNAVRGQIGELKSDLSELGDTIGFAKSYNADVLVSTAESTTTYLDVDISPQKQYNMTISVKSGTIENNRSIFVNVYYSDGSSASGKYQIYKDRVYSFVEEKQVVRLSIWIANAPNEAALLFSLEPISKFENIKKYVDDSIEHTNVLHGKKLYCGGDSITEAVNVGSFDNGYKKSYGGIVAYRNNMEYVSDGVGGSTIGLCKIDGAYTNNFIQSRYKNIPTDAGYITLWFGWNDNAYGWKSKRDEYCVSNYGTYYSALTDEQKAEVDTTNWRTWLNQYIADKDSTDITTWCGAWNTVLDWILENCPNAHVGVCIGYGVDDSFKQPIIDVCKKHGVPYLKCYDSNDCFSVGHSDGISASVATQRKSLYTLDNTHPNELGYEMISTSYEQFLKRI